MSIESPCTKVCVLDDVTSWCIGCGRTGGEIATWLAMSAAQRREVMLVLPERLIDMTARQVRNQRPETRQD